MSKKITIPTLVLLSAFALSASASINTSAIPLGDGKISNSPKNGYVYSCQQQFSPNAGGAQADGSWINGSTWNLNEKISVQGRNSWPNAQFSMTLSGSSRILSANGLPVDSYTGNFPVSSSDPAYQIDRNPNSVMTQNVTLTLPANPTLAETPSCVDMGMIGVATNGVALFNALDGRGDDAVAHEVQDICSGHPERTGQYHYHGPSSCISESNSPNTLLGYALDGFGIYSNIDSNGNVLTNADLDECHGTTSPIMWGGKLVNMYHYVMTTEYPYTVGCYRGAPVKTLSTTNNVNMQNGQLQMPISQTGVVTTVTDPLNITSTLKIGSRGDEVVKLQEFLKNNGYLTLNPRKNGYFDYKTKKALRNYQKDNNMQPTGVFGSQLQSFFSSLFQSFGNSSAPEPTMNNFMQQSGTAPLEAITACSAKSSNSSCSFMTPDKRTITGQCLTPPNSSQANGLVCVPR